MTVHISQSVLERLSRHAVRELPDECCGILMGRRNGSDAAVRRAVPANNIAESDRRNSYQVDWETLFAALRTARPGPGEIVGFYHSHPDGSTTPSQRDRELIWPGRSYIIVSITDRECSAVTSWRAPHTGVPFQREPLLLAGSPCTPLRSTVRTSDG
ncbi:MAG: M67 family metallopeptidase [Phycisphaerales bacterium]|nr:MAG: M67 family metallopeptidase [Phycisphaerales bacterium]